MVDTSKLYSSRQVDAPVLMHQLRQLLGLTQEQFSAEVGVALVRINRWGNNRAKPLPLALKQIKAKLNQLRNSLIETYRTGAQSQLLDYFGKA
ncbi:helix-turn-helix domain-containing protein [Nostoc sp. XA010]|uniref:helix-turn-helix domain-containing protein n=1 Tax=Nostoc sp. XA010 TaxID=2780407 RepID=UPI001E3F2A31|nr:helix-turn-helix transcriptional regulator [Nostoc sp. XA010]MCC5659132.1 helix-turn-helix domain-containing protein [Nostoc sp. XA010]